LTQFTAHGPFKVPTTKLASGSKTIGKDQVAQFWESNDEFAEEVGVYVFAIKAGQGITPMYIGKATKSFAQESFATDKLNKYFHAMGGYLKGTPMMFFVMYPVKRGKVNVKEIGELEKFLIQQGRIINPNLVNKVHAKLPSWSIDGVLRSKTKRPTKQATTFRGAFSLAG
jgi:hypothetical protein